MRNHKLHLHAIGILLLLGLQFLAGMLLNLFVELPSSHPGSTGGEYFGRSAQSLFWALSNKNWELATHAGIATLLVLAAASLFIRAIAVRDKLWMVTGGVAFLFVTGAFFNGLSFVDYNHDLSSMIMALCWLLAVATLVMGLVLALARPRESVSA